MDHGRAGGAGPMLGANPYTPAARGGATPSRVLHVRNLPPEVSEREVVALFLPFGAVERVLLLHNAKQALVQCSSIEMATRAVASMPEVMLGAFKLRVQFSRHGEIDPQRSQQLQANVGAGGGAPGGAAAAVPAGGSGRVLIARVTNEVFPLDIDIFYRIFGAHGAVARIATFVKDGHTTALVEFADAAAAAAARQALDGRCVYTGCCQLDVGHSKLAELTIRADDAAHRDYTVTSAKRRKTGGGGGGGHGAGHGDAVGPHLQHVHAVPHALAAAAAAAAAGLRMPPPVAPHLPPPGVLPFGAVAAGGFGPGGHPPGAPGRVLLVNNLPTSVTADELATLAGVWGDVARVKCPLFQKPGTALVQFAHPTHADRAAKHLEGLAFRGSEMRVTRSHHPEVKLGGDDGGTSRDLAMSDAHRFGGERSRNAMHVYPASRVLHVSNLPPDMATPDVTARFSTVGAVLSTRRFEKNPKMALVQMDSTEAAIEALLRLDNTCFAGDRRVRVTFSRSTDPEAR